MDRRTLVGAFAGSLFVRYSGVEAQPAAKVYRIGILSYATAEQYAPLIRELTEGLREFGYVDGRNVVIEPHYGDGTLKNLSNLAADVVRSHADVIVAGSNPITAAAKSATATIPIVMVGTFDPVGTGLVVNLARPGGNITGLTVDASPEMAAKNLGLLTEIIPGALTRGGTSAGRLWQGTRRGSKTTERFASRHRHWHARRTGECFRRVEREAGRCRDGYWVDVLRASERGRGSGNQVSSARHARSQGMRTSGTVRDLWSEFGGSLSAGRRLRRQDSEEATKPGNLAVEQATKFDLVINLNTAKLLGVAIPQSVLLRADEVIR